MRTAANWEGTFRHETTTSAFISRDFTGILADLSSVSVDMRYVRIARNRPETCRHSSKQQNALESAPEPLGLKNSWEFLSTLKTHFPRDVNIFKSLGIFCIGDLSHFYFRLKDLSRTLAEECQSQKNAKAGFRVPQMCSELHFRVFTKEYKHCQSHKAA